MTGNPKSTFANNFIFVFGSQVIVLISGFIKALVIPVLLGLSDYGYWQIYVFYTVYIGVFTLGYGDGLYLNYGGYKLGQLPLNRIRAANALYFLMLVLGAVALMAFSTIITDPQRQIAYLAIAANVAVLGITSNISLTLQATNELKGYALVNLADKVFFTVALIALFRDDFQTFEYLIAADLGAKIIVMTFLFFRYRQLFIGPVARLADGVKEFVYNLSTGIQLLIANLSGMLVLGIGRIIVEYSGALVSYAYYAFAVSLANVALISINALSIVIYPTLRRQPKEEYIIYFNKTTRAYTVFILVMLTGYFPATIFVELVATQYISVIHFLNAIFVITALQGKMQLVNNTYYKALRLEWPMLVANVTSLLIATILSLAGFFLTESILAISYAALVTMVLRVYASELFLRRQMGEKPEPRLFTELAVLVGFMFITSAFTLAVAACVWLFLVVAVAIRKRAELVAAWRRFRRVVL